MAAAPVVPRVLLVIPVPSFVSVLSEEFVYHIIGIAIYALLEFESDVF